MTASTGSRADAERAEGRRLTIPDSVRELVDTAPLAHLATLNADGGPQVTLVWVGIDDDEFVMAHLGEWQKVKNVKRDARVALSMLGHGTNAAGLRDYLVVYGTARITEGGAVSLLQRLARLYVGPKADFPPAPLRDRPGFVTRIAPTRFSGVGPWAPAR